MHFKSSLENCLLNFRKNRSAVVRFTVKNGASVNKAHAGGNT